MSTHSTLTAGMFRHLPWLLFCLALGVAVPAIGEDQPAKEAKGPGIKPAELVPAAPSEEKPVTGGMKVRSEDGKLEVLVGVRIAKGYHVYAPKEGSPYKAVKATLVLPKGFEATGDWEYPAPEKDADGVLIYHHFVVLRQAIKGPGGEVPKAAKVTGELQYQACNDQACMPPAKLKLSAAIGKDK